MIEESNGTLLKFKEFMSLKHNDYVLLSETGTTLSYKKDIPAESANCATAGCLLLLGILPGIIYYFVTKKDGKVLTLNAVLKGGQLIVGGHNGNRFASEFRGYLKR